MEHLIEEIKNYKEINSLNDIDCAKKLDISVENLKLIISNEIQLEDSEIDRILNIIKEKKKFTGRKVIRILDLLFRCGAAVMALVVLLLCINGYNETHTLIALLSISVVSSSMTLLPKIEK